MVQENKYFTAYFITPNYKIYMDFNYLIVNKKKHIHWCRHLPNL